METGKNKGNLLCELVPEAREFFDFEKNKGIDFDLLTVGSITKCHWKCPECGLTSLSAVHDKVRKAKDGVYRFSGCSECNRKQLHGENRLVVLFPKARDYYDFDNNQGIDFESLTISSEKKLHWRCPDCGREQYASVNQKVRRNKDGSYIFRDCNKCAQKQRTKKCQDNKNKLIDLLPKARDYYDFDKNRDVDFESLTIASSIKCHWKCPNCGLEQYASVNRKARKEKDGSYHFRGCNECARKHIDKKHKLVDLFPESKNYFNFEKNKDIDFESLTIASSTKCYWKCPECGMEQYTSVSGKIVKKENGACRIRACSGCKNKGVLRQEKGRKTKD